MPEAREEFSVGMVARLFIKGRRGSTATVTDYRTKGCGYKLNFCPECGKAMVIKIGRYGKFMACSGYPECKFSKPITSVSSNDKVIDGNNKSVDVETFLEEKCDKCGGKMMLKEGRFGKFLACENYPKCKNTKAILTMTGVKCPDCGEGELVEKRTKRGKIFWGCSRYPGCKYGTWNDPKKSVAAKEQSQESNV